MPVLVVGTERNFAALRSRLFEGRVSTAVARRVEDAVRVANPGVDLDQLRPGTVLSVPDLPELRLGENDLALDEGTKALVAGLHAAATAALDGLVVEAGRLEEEGAAERKELARAMQARPVQDAASKDADLAADLEAARKAVAEEEAAAKGRPADLAKARAAWENDLDALRGMVS